MREMVLKRTTNKNNILLVKLLNKYLAKERGVSVLNNTVNHKV
jgi:hypothetical protein